MALMCRRKAFCVISRYRLCGRFASSSSSIANNTPVPPPPCLSQMIALGQPRPAMAMHSSPAMLLPPSCKCTSTFSVSSFTTRNHTIPAFCAGKGTTKDTPCCFTHKCASRYGCSCTKTSGSLLFARNCTTTAYPPPTPPGEFQGGDEEGEADGAPLNVDEAAEEAGLPPQGDEDFEMPPFDNVNDAEDDGDYVDEDPPPDPEEALLFSPSDSD